MILDLGYRRKGYLHNLASRDLDLDAGRGESLGGLHASNCSAHAPAIGRNDLNIVLAVKWLQSRECLGNFHNSILPDAWLSIACLDSDIALYAARSLITQANATGKHYLAYRTCPCILRLNSNKVSVRCQTIQKCQCPWPRRQIKRFALTAIPPCHLNFVSVEIAGFVSLRSSAVIPPPMSPVRFSLRPLRQNENGA